MAWILAGVAIGIAVAVLPPALKMWELLEWSKGRL